MVACSEYTVSLSCLDGKLYTGTGRHTCIAQKWVPWSANLTSSRIASGKITPEVLWGQPHTVHFQVMLALLAKPTWVEGLVLKLELGLESPGGLMKTWTIELHPQSFCFSGNLHSDRFPGDVHAAGPGITLDKLLVGSAWIRPLEVKKKWGFSIQENFSRSSVSCVPLICKPKAEVSLYSVPPGTWIATLPHELLSILWCP